MTNRLSRRIYVQVAEELSGEVGMRAQKAALMAIRDSFKKIIVLGRPIVPTYDEEGIFYIGFWIFCSSRRCCSGSVVKKPSR